MPIYENLVIGNFLFALGLRIGARQGDLSAAGIGVHFIQQTPVDVVLGDVLLAGPRAVALLEFKRRADRRWKERGKLRALETILRRPGRQALCQTSRQMHFFIETGDILDEDFSQVRPYLDLERDIRGIRLEQFIDEMVHRATSAPPLGTVRVAACQRYLKLVCTCQGRSYRASPGLLVGVGGDGRIAFAPLDDLRDLQSTLQAIHEQEIAQSREDTRLRHELTKDLDLKQRLDRGLSIPRHSQTLGR